MDSKTFISRIARQMDCDTRCVSEFLSAFASVVGERASELDTVTVPGFGNFVPTKHPERVETDAASGKQMLMPPKISVDFVAGSALKKHLSHE